MSSEGLRPVEWKAEEYDHQAAPHEQWADEVLGRLVLRGDETILDAGCGTGRLTRRLAERVPDGRVIGVDASADMLTKAHEWLGDDADLRQVDLTDFDLGGAKVDAVYSSAVFHWISDHDGLFRSLHRVMDRGAQLEAQCGGQDNIAEIERALESLSGDERFAPYLRTERRAWNYASIGDTELRLERAGFSDIRVWTQPWPVTPPDPIGYLATVILPWHLDRLPDELHEEFVDAVIGSAPRPLVVNYVRLNISARA